ncbi:putative subtilase family serine protease [Neospora caninum Liverpool]|uniref:subtilisin n=1 Tax=Neospora caninum (strain Liverpool) TaxID=572307 RepID=F0VDR6_NEOCL|nr:putative subtilase family serine protease [Neospora caninum Liverpool]CBZ51859.1 putative subtilase family serine protease [Neospora caninum Liverpool]|eukprot:XP_003881892.1 putative subtilase family serine protease [Neospora caninum Liverpool]
MERAANQHYRSEAQIPNTDPRHGDPDKTFQGQSRQDAEELRAGATKNVEGGWAPPSDQKASQVFHVSLFHGEELRKLADEDKESETESQRAVDSAAETSSSAGVGTAEGGYKKSGVSRGTLVGNGTRSTKTQTGESAHEPQGPSGVERESQPLGSSPDGFLSPYRQASTFARLDFPLLSHLLPSSVLSGDPHSASGSVSLLDSAASAFQPSEAPRALQPSPNPSDSTSPASPSASALGQLTGDSQERKDAKAGERSHHRRQKPSKGDLQGRSFHGSAITQVRYVLWGKSWRGSDDTATPSSYLEDEEGAPVSEEREEGEGQMRKNAESVCTIDGAALHHLSCEVIRLHDCNAVIDPQLLAAYLRESPCVEAVGFDQQAAPCIVEEETKPLLFPSLRPLQDDGELFTESRFQNAFSPSELSSSPPFEGPTFGAFVPQAGARRRKEPLESKTENGLKKEEESQPEESEDGEEERYPWNGNRGSKSPDPWTKMMKRFKGFPNDPLLSWIPQWELLNDVTGVDADLAWKRTKGGSGSIEEQPANTIAVVDFGFQLSHEDLWHKWWRNTQVGAKTGTSEWPHNCADGIDNDENGYVDDCFGFELEAALRAVSVSFTLLPGIGLFLGLQGSYSQIAEAVNYAADKGVKVINLSLGGPASPVLRRIVEQADKRNITLVVAAGNHRCDLARTEEHGCRTEDGNPKGYPAAYSDTFLNVISVGATDKNGKLAAFTNFDSSPSHSRVQVVAPGRELPSCSDRKGANNGTSFAAPIVAAIVGLLQLERPDLPPRAVRALLVNSCKVTGDSSLPSRCQCGGLVSAERALKLAGVARKKAKDGREADGAARRPDAPGTDRGEDEKARLASAGG